MQEKKGPRPQNRWEELSELSEVLAGCASPTCVRANVDREKGWCVMDDYKMPPYNMHVIVPLGLGPEGAEIAVEVILRTLVEETDGEYRTTDLGTMPGPAIRGCCFGLPKGKVRAQTHEWIRENLADFKERWVPDDLLLELMDMWERWHLNDSRIGTEAQMALVGRLTYFEEHAEHKAALEAAGLWVDRGYEYASGRLVIELNEATAVKLIDLVDRMCEFSEKS